MENENIPLATESIKLIKNSKGYNWEIKILPNLENLGEHDLIRLDAINANLSARFPTPVKEKEEQTE